MAGSWSTVSYREAPLGTQSSRPIGVVKTFIADASDHTIPADEVVADVSGLLTGIDVEFDDTTPPDALVVAIKTIGGITLVTGAELTASGRIAVSPPLDVCGGYKIATSANTTNSAQATIVCLFR